MNHLERLVRFALMVGVIVTAGAMWLTPLAADTDSGKASLKQIMEKPSKSPGDLERPAAGVPDDALGRGTPRSSVRGFLSSAKDRDYMKAAEYLDLRNLPSGMTQSQGPELARQLRIVLDQTLWIDVDALSTDAEGDQSDNLSVVRERVGRISAEGKTYDLYLQRVPRGDGVYIWKFADVTVEQIPQLYQQFGYGQLERVLPRQLFGCRQVDDDERQQQRHHTDPERRYPRFALCTPAAHGLWSLPSKVLPRLPGRSDALTA